MQESEKEGELRPEHAFIKMTERLPEGVTERVPILPGIEVICGPMFSGKSEVLIGRLKKAPHAGYLVLAFKPDTDDRRGKDTINTQDGQHFPAQTVVDSRQILDLVGEDIDIVGIDEAQFFDKNLVEVCRELARRGKRVMVAGLDKNFRGKPFGPMALLKQEADQVDTQHAYCKVCGRDASFTQRIINGKPAKYSEPIVVVGADEMYEARCRAHHIVPGKPTRRIR